MRLRLKTWHEQQRSAIAQRPVLNQLYRVAVGAVGTVLMLAGLVMIPLPIPGPGWASLFLGLAVLSTEFTWAHRVTTFLRLQLHRVGELSARLLASTRAFLHANVAYHRATMLAHARTAYTRFAPLPVTL